MKPNQSNHQQPGLLKKVLKKSELTEVLADFAESLGAFAIEDADGHPLFTVGDGGQAQTMRHPIIIGGETAGAVVGDNRAAPLARLISLFGERELERRALAAETLHKYKEITLLYNLAQRLSVCLDQGEIAWLIDDETRKFIDGDQVGIKLLRRDSDRLQGIGDDRDGEGAPAIELMVCASGQGEIVNEIAADPRFKDLAPLYRSLLCAPLKIKDQVVGTLTVGSIAPRTYTAEHLQLLNTIAAQAAAAIENARLYEELQETFFATVQTLAETIEKRDPYTAGHTRRVMEYSLAIGEEMALPQERMTTLRLAAILHDIGKIGVRDSVLLKEGRLSEEEFAAIKQHTVFGEEILAHVPQMSEVIAGVRHHHERYDGKGYPDSLTGAEIDLAARIIAVADTFDAMTTNRPYRKGLDSEVAFAELRRCAGSQFDPEAVAAFFRAHGKGKINLEWEK